MAPIPPSPSRNHARLRLLHRRDDLAAPLLRALLHRTRKPPRPPRWLHHQSERRLGHPTSAQPQLHRPVRPHAVPRPRPRQVVRRRLRRGLPQRRDRGDPYSNPRATSERLRRTLRPHHPHRVSRLAVDRRPPPSRDSATHLHRALQPRAPPPRTRDALARLDKRGPAGQPRSNQAPRPTRRTNPRVPPRRMNRHFETPQAIGGKSDRRRRGQNKPKPLMVRNAMKKGLPSDTLQLVDWELSRGGPFRCSTPVWISAASVSTSICLTVSERPSRLVPQRRMPTACSA